MVKWTMPFGSIMHASCLASRSPRLAAGPHVSVNRAQLGENLRSSGFGGGPLIHERPQLGLERLDFCVRQGLDRMLAGCGDRLARSLGLIGQILAELAAERFPADGVDRLARRGRQGVI